MVYVEWLRVRGTLKWTAIVLGILFVLAALARIDLVDFHHHSRAAHEMKFAYYALSGALFAMIVATILGAPFARENDGHLEVALTKPVDRTGLALETMGMDVAGILAAIPIGVVWAIAAHALFYPLWITFGFGDAIALVLAIIAPLAWYAMLAAATASLKRGYAAVLSVAWPLAVIVAILGVADARYDPMLSLLHDTFRALSLIDPLAYMQVVSFDHHGQPVFEPAWVSRLTMLGVLAFGYGALAVFQWRRVEA